MGSNWSYVLAGMLAFAWFFYVTSKGELPAYLEVIGLINAPATSTPSVAGAGLSQTLPAQAGITSQPGATGAYELGIF